MTFFFQRKHFSCLVKTDGQERGEVLGKKMAEQIMTRELMTWTGVSRTAGCEKKFAFQTLDNLVMLFYKVMVKADSRWSYEKNKKLFSEALLKHAKKRALAEKEKLENKKVCVKKNSTSVESVAQSTSHAYVSEEALAKFLGEYGGGSNKNNRHPNETGQDSNDNGGDLW